MSSLIFGGETQTTNTISGGRACLDTYTGTYVHISAVSDTSEDGNFDAYISTIKVVHADGSKTTVASTSFGADTNGSVPSSTYSCPGWEMLPTDALEFTFSFWQTIQATNDYSWNGLDITHLIPGGISYYISVTNVNTGTFTYITPQLGIYGIKASTWNRDSSYISNQEIISGVSLILTPSASFFASD